MNKRGDFWIGHLTGHIGAYLALSVGYAIFESAFFAFYFIALVIAVFLLLVGSKSE